MSEFHVGLLVSDVQKLVRFYQDLFGVVPAVIIEHEYVEFSLGSKLIVDIETSELVKSDVGEVHDTFYLRLEVENIEKFHEKCKRKNITVVIEPMKKDYGKIEMYIRDPEGNLVQCFQKIQ